MIGLSVKIEDRFSRVAKAADKAAFKSFQHAAASISKDVKSTLEKAPQGEASEPGAPPKTHRGQFLKRAIRFSVDKDGAVIGPIGSLVGEVGAVHEFGEIYHETDYPERPFMGPALDRAVPRFAGSWSGSIGE